MECFYYPRERIVSWWWLPWFHIGMSWALCFYWRGGFKKIPLMNKWHRIMKSMWLIGEWFYPLWYVQTYSWEMMGNDGMNDIVRWLEWKMKKFNDPYAKRGCYECAMVEQIVHPHVIKLWAIYLFYSIQIQVSIYWQNNCIIFGTCCLKKSMKWTILCNYRI
jgi:hypothetical protein